MNSDDVLVTEDGLKKLKTELRFLETDRRKQIANRLEEAISYGDLSENSEYQEAKEEQAFAEGRIIELTRKIKHAKIISDQHAGKVNLGSAIELKNKTLNEKESYTLVGSTEVDPFEGKISNESPLGSAMLGRKKGDVFSVNAPGGSFEYELLSV
ncbi:transcription elongation factor GreA, partial [Candidatus Peregrinibacteria bacterium]|nr:transcription elongation factor GreA [Candidatus Peregrinibacteria bacterium]